MDAPSSAGRGARPLISVVVAVKNGAATLPRCLASIFCQRDAALETVVIDGGSTDGTVGILEKESARLAYWRSELDSGVYAAWNKGLGKAVGEWICFLGADDKFHDERVVADLAAAAAASPRGVRVLYGRMNLVTKQGKIAETVGRPWLACREDFLAGFMIPHPGTLHHRSLFEIHGSFDTSYRIAGDYEMLLRELGGGEAHFIDRIVVDMQLGGASARPDSIWRALHEVVRAREKHGLFGKPPRLQRALVASRVGAWIHAMTGDRVFNRLADAYRRARGRPPLWTV